MKTLLRTLKLKRSSSKPSTPDSKNAVSRILKTMKTSNQRKCPLFTKLPTEIRLQIWSFVIGTPDIQVKYDDRKHPKNWAAIVRTCRLIHTETHPLLYTLPTLHFLTTSHLQTFKFSTSTTLTMWPFIAHIALTTNFKNECDGIDMDVVQWGSEKWDEVIVLLGSLPRLESVRLVVDDASGFLGRGEMERLGVVKVGVHRYGNGNGRRDGEGEEEGESKGWFVVVFLYGCKEEVRQMEREGGVGWRIVEGKDGKVGLN